MVREVGTSRAILSLLICVHTQQTRWGISVNYGNVHTKQSASGHNPRKATLMRSSPLPPDREYMHMEMAPALRAGCSRNRKCMCQQWMTRVDSAFSQQIGAAGNCLADEQ